ncbi:MAG: asparagine synthase (glutamine-hydrolyzing) [Planctomycetes bacterium]|nr:asparagine synthase (glutamine-hydrolyzing) [Planctomycetota bacterium]
MCGIAGVIDMAGKRSAPRRVVQRMAKAMLHRGPDEDGFLERSGMLLANRRLSIIGLADGKQPISNEDQSTWVVFNGEFFDYPEKRKLLESKGHVFRTNTDTELIPHLWEEYQEGMFEHLKGQFAFCLWDSRQNCLILARDRIGICPLFYSIQQPKEGPLAGSNVFMFASEVKSLLASGMVEAKADPQGINQIFSFFAIPGPSTCFDGVKLLLPGHYLRVQLGEGISPEAAVRDRIYWEIDFPDWGQEEDPPEKQVVEEYERLLLASVERRLRADVPVAAYLSGGVDSSMIVAMASKVLGRPIPSFTIAVQAKGLNEVNEAAQTARHVGSESIVLKFGDSDVCDLYPDFTWAAEMPVIDTSAASLMQLAKLVRANGYKVALTGEGADETLAGYSWFKIHKVLSTFGQGFGMALRNLGCMVTGSPRFSKDLIQRAQDAVGGHNGWLDLYGLMGMSKMRFYSQYLKDELSIDPPYRMIGLNHERINKWHPFNRSLYLGQRIMLPGHLLCAKGDRVAMNASVETRPPFLDEDLWEYQAKLHPRWKLRGLREKYLLRKVASRWLPKEVAWRRKAMFRAPLDSFHLTGDNVPKWIDQVLSPEALKKTGFFDVEAVTRFRAELPKMWKGLKRTSVEMGLVAVTATQLWHHLYISGDLADLPARAQRQSNLDNDYNDPKPDAAPMLATSGV